MASDRWVLCKDRLPEDGQKVFYFGILGLWRGTYGHRPLTHWIGCDEHGNTVDIPATPEDKEWRNPHTFMSAAGNCDTDEVTHWMPDDEGEEYVPLPPGYVEVAALLRRIAGGEYRYTADDYEQQRLVSRLEREAEALLDGHREFV